MRSQSVSLRFTHGYDQCSSENFLFQWSCLCDSLQDQGSKVLVAHSPTLDFFVSKQDKWVGPQMQTWMMLERHLQQKRLAGSKRQKAKFKSALLYSNGFWNIYQQLWNVASGPFKIITNNDFSLTVHINNNKKKPLSFPSSISFFPLLAAANLLSSFSPITAFSSLYSLHCFSLMISCWLQSSILRKQRALKIIVLLNVCKIVVGQLCGTPPLTAFLDTSLCLKNRIACRNEWEGEERTSYELKSVTCLLNMAEKRCLF